MTNPDPMTDDPRAQTLLEYVQHKPDCPRSLPNLAFDLGPGWTTSVSFAKPCNCGLDALLAVIPPPVEPWPRTGDVIEAAYALEKEIREHVPAFPLASVYVRQVLEKHLSSAMRKFLPPPVEAPPQTRGQERTTDEETRSLTHELLDLIVLMPDSQVDEILTFIATLREARAALPTPREDR